MASELCHHQNHLPDRLRGDGCGADDRAWMMSSRELPTTMYRSWVWCAECSSLDVCGTLWTNLLPRTKNKATIEVFAGQPNEESDWETTTYCPSTRLVSRSSFLQNLHFPGFCFIGDCHRPDDGSHAMARWQSGHAADCKSAYAGSIPTLASIAHRTAGLVRLFFCLAQTERRGSPLFGYWPDFRAESAEASAGAAWRSSHASIGGVTIAVSRDIATMIA